ncbi:telomere length regulation protein TEL2 homolog [Frankliniella occidentalis]|uniref:Telomere length regulation protein TEL2 homolog n=1 Tax=Frankliniella occidentalis TaxID=133901 RepID=A0A6J1SPY2_FRAOC|nr:telomere length regulation protein TEL2 homolog [Frankliniella occidentalis]
MNNFVNMWRVRELADKVTNVVMNYTEIEAKVREATNDEAWGPTGALMQEIAQATFTYEHFPEVMQMLWKRMLQDNKKNWRRTYKSLLLLNYLVRNGSERVVTAAREHVYDLRSLENYTYVDELGKDQGVNIRHKVRELMDFVQDDDRLREERKKAKKNKDKYVGMSSGAMGGRYGGDRWEEPRWRREEYGDWGGGGNSERTQGFEEKSSNSDEGERYDSDPEINSARSRNYDKERSGKEYKDNDSIGSGSAVSSPTSPSERGTTKSASSPVKKSSQPSKKVDLGAAAHFAKANSSATKPNNSSDFLSDILGKDTPSSSQTADDFFNPRGDADPSPGDSSDFGDFTSAFGCNPTAASTDPSKVKEGTDEFADFSSAFSSSSVPSGTPFTIPGNAVSPSQNLNNGNVISSPNEGDFTNSDLLGGLTSGFSSLTTGSSSTNATVMVKNNSNLLDDTFSSEWETGLDAAIVILLDDLAKKKSRDKPLEDNLRRVAQYIPGVITTQRFEGLDEASYVVQETWNKRYPELISALTARISSDWPLDNTGTLDKYFALIIAPDGASPSMLYYSMKTLVQLLQNIPLSRRSDAVIALLIKLIHSSAVFSSTLFCCVELTKEGNSLQHHLLKDEWEACVRMLVSLPSRSANVLKHNTPLEILPSQFCKVLCFHVACCLSFIANSDKTVNILPLSMLVNCILVNLKPHLKDSGVVILIRALIKWCAMDLGKVRMISSLLLVSLNRQAIETISDIILKECYDLGCKAQYVLGKAVLESTDWKYVLCTKIPFLKYSDYRDVRVISSLAQYFKDSPDLKLILKDIVTRLLSVWGDHSALVHTPLEQHIYITQALVMFTMSFSSSADEQFPVVSLKHLFKGVQIHLESPVTQIRAIGMITAELLSKQLLIEAVKFDYSGMDSDSLQLVQMIRNLNIELGDCRRTEEDGNSILLSVAKDSGFVRNNKTQYSKPEYVIPIEVEPPASSSKILSTCEPSEELDSDDDLVPFDLSNDKSLSDRKKPIYLRDMLEGLYEVEDMDRWCGSLIVCEDLVTNQLPDEDESLAINILEALVGLEPRFPVEDFSGLQMKGTVAVLIIKPTVCAEHLSKLFHQGSSTFSIRQRLFMLHAMTEASLAMCSAPSRPKPKESVIDLNAHESKFSGCTGFLEEVLDEFADLITFENDAFPKLWQKQIDKRVALKTRRVTSKTRVPFNFVSRFAPVAGSFFFPLIRGITQNCGTIVLLHQERSNVQDDTVILLRFILTLSVIMQCSENAPVAARMGAELLEFVWSVRYHTEASIRLAAIGCVLSVVYAVPQSRLQGDLRHAVLDAREWLQSIACGPIGVQDIDSKCRELARKVGTLTDVALTSHSS